MTAPLKATVAPGQPGRLFVVDRPGILWVVDLGAGAKTVFLDVSDRLVTLGVLGPGSFDERGFLGLAFHPEYATNGLLYTYTSEPDAGSPTFPTTLPAGASADHRVDVSMWFYTFRTGEVPRIFHSMGEILDRSEPVFEAAWAVVEAARAATDVLIISG